MDCGGEVKNVKIFLFAALAVILSVCSFLAEGTAEPSDLVTVYYFHGNFRCVNCRNIEQYTKEAVEKYFSKELGDGKVIFKVVNVENNSNEHFTNDYKLYTKSVVLSLIKNGKEIKFDNLTKIWEYLGDKEAFQQYIKSGIEKYLKEI